MKKFYLLFLFIFLVCIGISLYFISKQKPVFKNIHVQPPISTTIPHIDHIAIIVMENKSAEDIIGNNAAPFINSLAKTYSYASNYSAVTHPSLPNYIALIGGDTFGIASDCDNCFINRKNLVDQLEKNNKTWKAYMESMPSPCFLGNDAPYAQKHNPFIYFDNIRSNPNRCNNIVPFAQLSKDLNSANSSPNFIFISPNLCNDMHDCPIATGDKWLQNTTSVILNSNTFKQSNSLLVITWDEAEVIGNNIVPTIFVGKDVKKAYVSNNAYSHYSLLHTIETVWGMPNLTNNVSNSSTMLDLFANP